MKKIFTPKCMMILSMAIFGTLAPFVRRVSVSSGELAVLKEAIGPRQIAGGILILGFTLLNEIEIRIPDKFRRN